MTTHEWSGTSSTSTIRVIGHFSLFLVEKERSGVEVDGMTNKRRKVDVICHYILEVFQIFPVSGLEGRKRDRHFFQHHQQKK
jgi:hypothetical protein